MPARPRRFAKRLLTLALTIALSALLAGCNQLSAKRNNSRLQRILSEIQVHEGPERPYQFRNEDVTRLESDINQISDLIAREQYAQAADLARRTMETAPALLQNVIQDHAAAIFQQAEEDIQIAEANEGSRENPNLWDTIIQTRDRARQARSDQKWQSVIDSSQKIVDDVRTLLLNLRNRAVQGFNQATNAMTAFDALHSEQEVPNLVVQSRDLTQRVQEHIENRQYRLAIATAEEALTKINETIVETKRSLSDKGISRLEALAAEVIEHGGDFRLGERYQTFNSNFRELLNFFYLSEFDQALAQIQMLTPVAQQLVLDTYEAEAQELLKLRADEIAQLQEAEVQTYLPGRIDEAITLHDQAQGQYQQAEQRIAEIKAQPAPALPDTLEGKLLDEVKPIFNQSVELSVDAGKVIDSIHRAFRELAENHLADAQSAINVAVDVLGQFNNIWDPRVDRATDPSDVQFEQNKQLMRAEIEKRLESARILKATADFRLADQRYNIAIQYADQARSDAQAVLADTYRVAARYALIELTWLVQHYEREGAGEYATAELDRTLRLIADTRQTLETGDPREAVSQAADAKAQLEIMIQSLRRVANETIEQLRGEEAKTRDMLDNVGAPERLALITQLRTTAESQARADALKDAIETAQRGLRLAETTTTDAAREWAQDELEDARSRIAHAEEAGAALYAATTLQTARDQANLARERFEASDYLAAESSAAEAASKADEARMALVDRAEEAAVRANDYDGWRFQSAALADALVANQRALRAMNEGNFAESRDLAIFAQQRADEVTQASRQSLYGERVQDLRTAIEHAMATGSNYFQPAELESILDDLARIETSYTPERYDDFERDLEALESRMAILIEGTPEILTAALDSYRDWVHRLRDSGADLYAHGELESVAEAMRSAKSNFDTGHYRLSYQDVQRAGHLLTGVQVMADEFVYKNSVDDILNRLEHARSEFGNWIRLSPAMLTYMAVQPNGATQMTSISSNYSPSEFRHAVEQLQQEAEQITPPPTQVDHYEKLLAALRNAQSAARDFELLSIADQMNERTVSETVDSAYSFLEASRRQSEELTAALLEAPLHAPPVTMTETGRSLLLRAEANFSHGQYR